MIFPFLKSSIFFDNFLVPNLIFICKYEFFLQNLEKRVLESRCNYHNFLKDIYSSTDTSWDRQLLQTRHGWFVFSLFRSFVCFSLICFLFCKMLPNIFLKVCFYFCSKEWIIIIFLGMVRNGIPEFSVPRNSRNSVRINHLFRLFRLPQKNFLSEIANPNPQGLPQGVVRMERKTGLKDG